MNFLRKITLHLLLYFTLSSAAFAQVVDIPDLNLRAAVRDALNGAPITQANMRRLTQLDAFDRGIVDLTGLEYAINLKALPLWGNPLADLTPIASLKNLTYLDISACSITDTTALSNLTGLTSLNARSNYIVDITPLANLTNLERLRLNKNRIIDVSPLANLTSLEFLEIHHNQIVDYSPLDTLALSHFTYDQICEMTPLPLEPRLDNRDYPSIFTRWGSPNTNRPELSHTENIALHDLNFDVPQFGLAFRHTPHGVTIAGIIDEAVRRRDEFLSINTNMIFLMYIEIRSFPRESEPEDWPYWIRDANGNVIPTSPSEHDGLIDFTHPVVQDRIVQQAIAVSKCGLYDGIMFDYWTDKWPVLVGWDLHDATVFRGLNAERRARDNIVKRIRAATRPNFLIMGNNNRSTLPLTGPYINGGFMESVTPFDKTAEGIKNALNEVESTLFWSEENLREPHINGLEGWTVPNEPPDSPTNLRWMRVFTTLSLTHSDGYVSFKDSASTGHYWYDFWDADLGRPVGPTGQLYQDVDGLYIREFTNGWAVYNHSGAKQTIMLPELTTGVASRLEGQSHTLPNLDGEMYLRVKPANPADVNGDGVVNILDLTIIARDLGTDSLEGDVNRDGFVNILDLVFVANQF